MESHGVSFKTPDLVTPRPKIWLRFQKKNGQLEKTGRMNQVKKDIARIKTKMNDEFLGDKDAK